MHDHEITRIGPESSVKERDKYIAAYLRLFNDPDNLIYLSKTGIPFSGDTVSDWLERSEDDGAGYYVVYDKGEIVAIMVILYNTIDCFEVLSLVVDGKYRRSGIAGALLKKAERVAREKGFRAITIKVFADNPRMLSLVIKNGFKPVKIEYRVRFDGEDMVYLHKYFSTEV